MLTHPFLFRSHFCHHSLLALLAFDSRALLAPSAPLLGPEICSPLMRTHTGDDELCLVINVVDDFDICLVLYHQLTDCMVDLDTVMAHTDFCVGQFPELDLASSACHF